MIVIQLPSHTLLLLTSSTTPRILMQRQAHHVNLQASIRYVTKHCVRLVLSI